LGKTVRDGYEHIQLNSDFLPDYVGIIIYHEGKFYFRNYGKINIFVDNKRLEDSSVAMRLVHGSMIKIQYSENKNVYIGCIEGELDNKWKVFKPETNEVLDIQKDKKGYVIIFKCKKCGAIRKNKAAEDDNMDKIIELSSKH